MEPIDLDEYRQRSSRPPVDCDAMGIDTSTEVATAWAEIEAVAKEMRAALDAGHSIANRPDLVGRLRSAESTIYAFGPSDGGPLLIPDEN